MNTVNDAPTARDDRAAAAEDTTITLSVLANDSDPDGDPLSFSGVSQPAHGRAATGSNGTVTYTPEANYNGGDSFTYTVTDGHGGTATGIVTITVIPVNDAPAAADDALVTAEDTAATVAVLENDGDVDGDSVRVTGAGAPAHGSAVLNSNGTITYTPAANYNGPDSFTYAIADGRGASATATVSVTVTAVNDGPQAAGDAAITTQDTAVTVAVLANDTDVDGDGLVVTDVSAAGHGSVSINADGTSPIHRKPRTAARTASATHSAINTAARRPRRSASP